MNVGAQVLKGVKFRMMHIFLNEDLAKTGEADLIED